MYLFPYAGNTEEEMEKYMEAFEYIEEIGQIQRKHQRKQIPKKK